MKHVSLIACAVGLGVFVAACASTPPADSPDNATTDTTSADASPPDPTSSGPTNDTRPPPSTTVKATGVDRSDDGSIPDDYQLTNGDCNALGEALTGIWRGELVAQLSPKLSAKAREQAEKSIDDASTKKGDDFAASCAKSLVGKTVDQGSLKCAFNSKSVKDFDKCLNGG